MFYNIIIKVKFLSREPKTGKRGLTEAVDRALQEFIHRKRLEALINLRGKISLKENWRKLREPKFQSFLKRPGLISGFLELDLTLRPLAKLKV